MPAIHPKLKLSPMSNAYIYVYGGNAARQLAGSGASRQPCWSSACCILCMSASTESRTPRSGSFWLNWRDQSPSTGQEATPCLCLSQVTGERGSGPPCSILQECQEAQSLIDPYSYSLLYPCMCTSFRSMRFTFALSWRLLIALGG